MTPIDKLNPNFIPLVDDEYTFPGVIIKYFHEMATTHGWDSNTQQQYIYRFNHIIKCFCPDNHYPPITSYSLEDFNKLISMLKSKRSNRGIPYADPVVAKDKYLIGVVLQTAAEHIPDFDLSIIWGSEFSVLARGRSSSDSITYNFRSFTPEQEVKLFHYLTDSPDLMSGEDWGMCLEYSLGIRNNEAVATLFRNALSFSHIVPTMWIYESESSANGIIEAGTKTENGNRPTFIPELIYINLLKRFKHVVQYVSDHLEEYQSRISKMPLETRCFYPELRHDTVEEFCLFLPIACKGHDYLIPTTSRRLTDAGKKLFMSIDFDEELFYFSELKSIEEEAESNIKVHDPTTYMFRRNYFTHLYKCLVGLIPDSHLSPIAALQFLTGHKIEFGNFDRRMMLEESVQRTIYHAFVNRPLLNNISNKTISVSLNNYMLEQQLLYNETIEISGKSGEKIIVQIAENEPNDRTSVSFFKSGKEVIKSEYFTWNQNAPYTTSVNVLKDYQSIYIKVNDEYLTKKHHHLRGDQL